MKIAKKSIQRKSNRLPEIKFQDIQLTSFAGLAVIQHFIQQSGLWEKVTRCCKHLSSTRHYQPAAIIQCLVIHLLLGYRKLRDMDFYRDDPMVKNVLGLENLPSVPTASRLLGEFDNQTVENLQTMMGAEVLMRVKQEGFKSLTLDFDGSVLSSRRHAEGSAVGYNKKKKGQRSYYPLMATLAQTGQVFDVLHRSGNVHDSKGALEFVRQCVERIQAEIPGIRMEVRMDSAFYSEAMIKELERLGVEYTISVPFERFGLFKKWISERSWWHGIPGTQGKARWFEKRYRPKSWKKRERFLFIRQETPLQQKGPLQLDLFEPRQMGYTFKAIITNKRISAKKVVRFHEGRGYQETLYSELKSKVQMEYIPCRKWVANRIYLLANFLTHNAMREMQMSACPKPRKTTEKRTVRWVFEGIDTLRKKIIQRAGKISFPQGRFTLTLSPNPAVEAMMKRFL